MSTQLETSTNQTFNFFHKTKKKDKGLFANIWPLLLSICICIIFKVVGLSEEREKADVLIISNISQKEYVSAVSKKSIKDIVISLEKKDWENTQYLLMKLSQLKSSKVNADVIGLLADYATTNFKSKKLPYSNTFSLLATNYLISTRMQRYENNETTNIKKLESAQTILLGTKEIIQTSLDEEKTTYAQSSQEINRKAKLLIEGLKDGKNKKLLSTSFY